MRNISKTISDVLNTKFVCYRTYTVSKLFNGTQFRSYLIIADTEDDLYSKLVIADEKLLLDLEKTNIHRDEVALMYIIKYGPEYVAFNKEEYDVKRLWYILKGW